MRPLFRQGWRRQAQQLVLRLYPPLHSAFSAAAACCYLAYMFGKTDTPQPVCCHTATGTADRAVCRVPTQRAILVYCHYFML